jgi:fumarate reductase subunit C
MVRLRSLQTPSTKTKKKKLNHKGHKEHIGRETRQIKFCLLCVLCGYFSESESNFYVTFVPFVVNPLSLLRVLGAFAVKLLSHRVTWQ